MSNLHFGPLPNSKSIVLFQYPMRRGASAQFLSLDGPVDTKTYGDIRAILETQLSIRGDGSSFNFRALGRRWRFERVK